MKYTLINCYSDNNKGDSGIILSTIEFLRKIDSKADILGVSTYNYSDPHYFTEHAFLRQHITVMPSIFGELNIGKNKSVLAKSIRLGIDIFRLIIFLFFPKKFLFLRKIIFSKYERETIDIIEQSDYVISKGGSFICNEPDIREKLALFRFLFVFFVSIKLNKKIIILCQSIGPVSGYYSRKMVNYVLNKSYKVVLREKICIEKYTYLNLKGNNISLLNDIAFYLDASYITNLPLKIDKTKFNIGFTIKGPAESLRKDYYNMMTEAIKFCIDEYKAYVHIFPHVTIDDDLVHAYHVHKMLPDRYKTHIALYNKDYSAPELKALYSNVDIFIGTRLHSTIFAMGEFVPSICISYHGTKSRGIFANYSLEKYAIEEYSADLLIEAIKSLISNRENIKTKIKSVHQANYDKFISLFKTLFKAA